VNYFVDDKKGVHPFFNGDGVDRSLESLGRLLKRLSAQKKVYLILGNPVGLDFDPLKHIQGSRLGDMSVASGRLVAPMPQDQAQFNARLQQVAEANGAQVIAPFASLCADGQCIRSMPDDGSPAYKDIGHLRPRYTRSFATYIDPALLDDGAPAQVARNEPSGLPYWILGSPNGSSSGGASAGIRNSSLAQAPRSTPLQRALQNGR
jgi:hypothetical protein